MLKIQPDYTFLVQIALFVALWLVLKRLWFDPALRIIRERTARSDGAIKEARTIQAEAERMRAEQAVALDQVKAEAQRDVQEIVRRAEAEQKRLIGEAREEARRTMEEARGRIAQEVSSARQGLRESAHDVARIVAEKVLGRSL
jgi:F-type H+-transporting ATPase subunit b